MKIQAEPFTKKQLKELQEYIAPSVAILRSVLFLVALFLVGEILYLIQSNVFPSSTLFWVVPTIVFGIFLYVKAGKWTGGRKLREEIRKDLQNGVCNHLLVEPVNVIEFEEQEDEGPLFLVETSDNQMLLLAGQYLESYRRRKFPWDKFAILEAPSSKTFFGLKRMGDPIPVTEQRPPLAYSILKQIGSLSSNYVVLNAQELELLKPKPALNGDAVTRA